MKGHGWYYDDALRTHSNRNGKCAAAKAGNAALASTGLPASSSASNARPTAPSSDSIVSMRLRRSDRRLSAAHPVSPDERDPAVRVLKPAVACRGMDVMRLSSSTTLTAASRYGSLQGCKAQ